MKQYHFIVFILFAVVLQACVPRLESGQGTNAETYYTDKALVLLYHNVNANEEAAQSSTMSARQFEDHMTMLRTRGFRIISMDDFVQFMLHESSSFFEHQEIQPKTNIENRRGGQSYIWKQNIN